MPDISATQFFDENPLFSLIELKDGSMRKSYKSIMNNYILECKECGQQVEQRGNSKFKCRRCKRRVAKDKDGEWVIIEPEGDEAVKAEVELLKPLKSWWREKRMIPLMMRTMKSLSLKKAWKEDCSGQGHSGR
jgi:RNA polymerase subunit RPABC4/transcription elongation factor Spt4